MRKNQSGLTLVELLATIVLISMVVGLIWTTFFIVSDYNITETKKLHLQQEANKVLTHIQQKHRSVNCYRLNIQQNEITIESCETADIEFHEIVSSGFTYAPLIEREIHPKEQDLTIDLIVTDAEKPKLIIEIPTTISRFKFKY